MCCQVFVPSIVYLNDIACTVTLAFVPSNELPAWAKWKGSGAAGIESSQQPLSLQDDQWIGVDGKPFNMIGKPVILAAMQY
jgi:hypothetical protein